MLKRMTSTPTPGRNIRQSTIGPFVARMHAFRNSETIRRLETIARCNPLTSLFIGTFLTASAIPVTAFLVFLTGTFVFGLLALTAFQGGVLIFSTVILLACLVTPCFLSTMLAMVAYFAMKILKRFHLSGPLNAPEPTGRFIQLPVEILENVTSRIREIASTEGMNGNLHTRAVPASVDSTSYSREDRDESIQAGERDEEDTSDDVLYGSELSECAERQIRRRGLSTEAVDQVLKPRPQAMRFPSLKHGHLTLAVNAFIGENHVIRPRDKDSDVDLD